MQPFNIRRSILTFPVLALAALAGVLCTARGTSALAQEPDPATTLYVDQINVAFASVGGPRRQPVAGVYIVDGYGQPVNGALVVGDWSGCFKQKGDSALTQSYDYPQPDGSVFRVDGQAVIYADKTYSCWGSGKVRCSFTFKVTGVFLNGMTYVPVAGKTTGSAQCW